MSRISIGYKNPEVNYIADKVFPIVPVDKQSDYYYLWEKGFWFRNHVERRAPGAIYTEGGLELSAVQYVCAQYGLAYPLPREVVANQDVAVNLERTGAEWLADQFMLNREIACSAGVFVASVWGTDLTLTGATQWSDYEASDPLGAIDTAKNTIRAATGVTPNTLILGQQVWDKIKWHPDLVDKFKFTQTGILTEPLIAKVFDVPNLMVGSAIYNTVKEGVTFSGAFIWGKEAVLLYVPPSPGLMTPASGYTFVWNQGMGLTTTIKNIPDDLRNRDVLQGDQFFVHKITGGPLGYRFATAVA